MERDCLQQVVTTASAGTIVATGGGTPCFYNNTELMKSAGTVVYLKATVPYLLARQAADNTIRPLLQQAGDVAVYLEATLAARSPFYERAHIILPVGDISLTTFAQILT
ncbi:MAG: hypothetical protein EBZ77_10240 [Chitinophagia bacterium]|nr:hypothetical protein [Chitinophagia bacterium]